MSARSVISIEGVRKTFGDVIAVNDVSLDFAENEFFALLGPSGCGKTTLLRLLAGFEAPDDGRLLLDGADLTRIAPRHRPLNMMFQSYALFPHMTVAGNIAYGLEAEHLDRAEIRQRVDDVMAMTQLRELARRRPASLSGGQRQRVALARAIVKRPRVLLLDEPLAALDKKLREQMQLELKRLQHEVGITFVVVTHDQEEALVMADRIAVMNSGRIVQVGTPAELYEQPATRFVAGFIGMMNLIDGVSCGDGLRLTDGAMFRGAATTNTAPGNPVTLAVRPERIAVFTTRPDGELNTLGGNIVDMAYHGQFLDVHVEVGAIGGTLMARLPISAAETGRWKVGQRVWCGWPARYSRILEH